MCDEREQRWFPRLQAWMAGLFVRPYWNQEHQMKSKLGGKHEELSGKTEFEVVLGHLRVVVYELKIQRRYLWLGVEIWELSATHLLSNNSKRICQWKEKKTGDRTLGIPAYREWVEENEPIKVERMIINGGGKWG